MRYHFVYSLPVFVVALPTADASALHHPLALRSTKRTRPHEYCVPFSPSPFSSTTFSDGIMTKIIPAALHQRPDLLPSRTGEADARVH